VLAPYFYLVTHRLILVLTLFLIFKSQSEAPSFGSFLESKLSNTYEMEKYSVVANAPAQNVFSMTSNPFYWITRWLSHWFGLSALVALILVSNLFVLAWMWELYQLLRRLTTETEASSTLVLLVFWPTSYEWSMGSSIPFLGFLTAVAFRHTMDNRWFFTGLAVAALGLVDNLAWLILPFLGIVFWFFQKHFQWTAIVKRALFLLIPLVGVVVWKGFSEAGLSANVQHSAFLDLARSTPKLNFTWAFSYSWVGQTVAWVVFLIGSMLAAMANLTWMHRLLPAWLFICLMFLTPYRLLASHLVVGAVCLQGYSSYIPEGILKLLQALFFAFTILELINIFA